MTDLLKLKRVIDIEYSDIVKDTVIYHDKLRVLITDGSLIDIWFSRLIPNRFSYHWERRHIDGTMYRHDNFPDPQWKGVSTFPEHFHDGSPNKVGQSGISKDPFQGVHEFMDFVRSKLS